MQGGDTVDGMRANGGKVGHAYIFLVVLVDERNARQEAVVAGALGANFIEEAAVDFVDDFKMARQ